MKPLFTRLTRYPITTGLILLVMLALLISCQQVLVTPQPAAPTTPETPTPVAESSTGCVRGPLSSASEVVIGVIYPLSQQASMSHGFAMLGATNLAVTNLNERGGINGKPIRTVVYDSASSATQGALYAERLATVDCAAAIVGVFHSDVALAVKEVAVRHHLPVVFADPYADEITSDHAPEIFRIAPTRTMIAQMMAEWLTSVGDYNQDEELLAVLLVENSRYGTTRAELAQQWLPSYGIRPVIFTVDLPATDFSPVIARIVALDQLPDAIFIYLQSDNNFLLQEQLLAAGIGPTGSTLLVNTASTLDDQKFWAQVPNGAHTVVTQIGPWYSTVTETGQQFAESYQQYFKRWPEAVAFEAYDVMGLIADAIQRANSLQADPIIRALETTDIELAAGHYTFPYGSTNPPDGESIPHYLWHQWVNPQLLYLQYGEAGQSARDAAVIWPPLYQTVDGPLTPELRQLRTP